MIELIKQMMQPKTNSSALFQLSIPFAIYLGSSYTWQYWLFTVLFSLSFYVLIGNNVGLHRYFTHKHFSVAKPVEWIFLWSGSMIMLGSPLSYAMTHMVHHKHPDTNLDPHGPVRGIRSWFIYFQKTVDPAETPMFSRRLIELKTKYEWVHRYYVPLVLLNAGLLYLIGWEVFLFGWWIPASIASWTITWSVWRQHIGFKANNSPIANWDIFSEGLHLNHHNYPMAPNTAVHIGEIDWTYQTSKLFKPVYDWRCQPKEKLPRPTA